MTENNIASTNLLLSFFGMKGNITIGLLQVYQYWCQHIGQSITDRALGTSYFAQENFDVFSHSNFCYFHILRVWDNPFSYSNVKESLEQKLCFSKSRMIWENW